VSADARSGLCGFEQAQRANWLKVQFAADARCTTNRLGQAIVGAAVQSQLQALFDDDVASGATSVLFTFPDLTDLSGTSAPSVTVGLVNGTPAPGAGYDGASDLDWWYAVDAADLDAQRAPLRSLPGSLAAKVLSAGPAGVVLRLGWGGAPTRVTLAEASLSATVGSASTPTAAVSGPPGHQPSEPLAPSLTSFQSMGQQTANGAGALCGEISAASLATLPIPSGLLGLCTSYTAANSMLDLLVGGCTALSVPQVAATQPDGEDGAVAAVGGGAPYQLVAGPNKAVAMCRDRNNAMVDLAACLADATYSSYFKFATGRVIAK